MYIVHIHIQYKYNSPALYTIYNSNKVLSKKKTKLDINMIRNADYRHPTFITGIYYVVVTTVSIILRKLSTDIEFCV